MKTLIKVCFITLAILLAVMPLLACGDAKEPPPAPAPSPLPAPSSAPPTGNQPPVITPLTAEPANVTPGETTKITLSATDPDGDILSFTWSATGGIIRGEGTIITWEAPDVYGEFVITVTVDDGKGGTVKGQYTINVVANQRPLINPLTAEPAKVTPGGASTITCTATDPDGDALSYTWSATGGTISGTGNIITWKAPDVDGEFVITVTVDDGKGGAVKGQYKIIVGTPVITAIFDLVPDESGSVYFTGDLVSSWLVGDNADNNGVRAFFSFDITSLHGAEIKEAKLTFNTKEIVGNPWGISAFLFVEQVDYGTRSVQGGDFDIAGQELAKFAASPPGEINVKLEIEKLLRAPVKPRFQVRLRLGQHTTYNDQEDYISFSGASVNITYVK